MVQYLINNSIIMFRQYMIIVFHLSEWSGISNSTVSIYSRKVLTGVGQSVGRKTDFSTSIITTMSLCDGVGLIHLTNIIAFTKPSGGGAGGRGWRSPIVWRTAYIADNYHNPQRNPPKDYNISTFLGRLGSIGFANYKTYFLLVSIKVF